MGEAQVVSVARMGSRSLQEQEPLWAEGTLGTPRWGGAGRMRRMQTGLGSWWRERLEDIFHNTTVLYGRDAGRHRQGAC